MGSDRDEPQLFGSASAEQGPAPPLSDPEIDAVVETYRREMARFEETAVLIERRLRHDLREQAVRCLLSSRAKHPDDLREKLRRKAAECDPKYTRARIRDVGAVVTDLAGVRVLVYQPPDAEKVRQVVLRGLGVVNVPCNDERKEKPEGYRALHLLVAVPAEERWSLRGTVCEVQIATLGQHVFNELEHDVGYKNHGVAPGEAEQIALRELWGAAQILDGDAKRLLHERGESLVRTKQILRNAAELRFVLERAAGRALSGEFSLLFRFLRSSVEPLTAAGLTALGLGEVAKLAESGGAAAARAGWTEPDDVSRILIAMYPTNTDELEALAREPDRPDWFRVAVETARRASGQGP